MPHDADDGRHVAPEYEYAEPVTVYGTKTTDQGGTQGTSQGVILQSPFGAGACEYAVQLVAFEATGNVAISANGQPPTVGVTNNGGVNGYMLHAPAAMVVALHPVFTPLKNGNLYISINVTGGNAALTFLFRRHKGHMPQFAPMFHTADPDNELLVNQARAEARAAQVAASESAQPKTR